jgi:ROS/MUCR transcriptional regulator protein
MSASSKGMLCTSWRCTFSWIVALRAIAESAEPDPRARRPLHHFRPHELDHDGRAIFFVVGFRLEFGLVCLICGKKQKLINRHLAVEHDLTPNQYRESFGLKPDYPMAAPNYAQQRRELAVKIGLGRPRKQRRGRKSIAEAQSV